MSVQPFTLIPAIDLKEGRCVRLRQGRMEDATVFGDDPVAMARRWAEQGARRLHLVDLDGAFAGEPKNAAAVKAICTALPELPVQIGGGIRNAEIAQRYVDAGVSWVIIGTRAVQEPSFVAELCRLFPGQVIVGIDAREGMVATEGWAESSSVQATDLARCFADDGVSAIVYTDIARDGMMQGANLAQTAALAAAVPIPVIASGGVSSEADIHALARLSKPGLLGAIVGRALYEGAIDLARAQQTADEFGTGPG